MSNTSIILHINNMLPTEICAGHNIELEIKNHGDIITKESLIVSPGQIIEKLKEIQKRANAKLTEIVEEEKKLTSMPSSNTAKKGK